ncbi:hypothetical protein ES705_25523 [subsurface metagenome]
MIISPLDFSIPILKERGVIRFGLLYILIKGYFFIKELTISFELSVEFPSTTIIS